MRPRILFFLIALTPAIPLGCGDDDAGLGPSDSGGGSEATTDATNEAADDGSTDATSEKRKVVGQGILNAVLFADVPSAAAVGIFQGATFTLFVPAPPFDAGPSNFK